LAFLPSKRKTKKKKNTQKKKKMIERQEEEEQELPIAVVTNYMSKVLDSLVHDEQEQELQADLKELLKGAQQSVSALGFLKQLHNIHKNSHRLDQNVLNKALRHLRDYPPEALFAKDCWPPPTGRDML
jgi:outer membrane biosynthesis protein TonB